MAGKRRRKALFPRCQQRGLLRKHRLPSRGLERVDELILVHPLLTRELVFGCKKLRGVRAPQLCEHGPVGELLFIHGVFERQPRKIVKGRLPHIARPARKKAARHLIAEPLVHKADDAVHVKVRFAVRFERQKLRLKGIVPARRPYEVDRPPLLGGIACRFHISP